jgi:asparagine synthetase A
MERQLVEMQNYVGKWIRETVAELHRTPFYPDGELTIEMIAIRDVLDSLSTVHVLFRKLESNYRVALGS